MCAATPGGGHGRDVTCAPQISLSHDAEGGSTMKNLIAPLGFTVLSAWVVLLFVLTSHNS
ncbi:hypothetical protein SAMN06264365_102352 [Actinoplanes regularis]|uniref:Uncharacterized protein n=1 Tax=Actinoplanes regularis TaxID=52697 RepID=A0A238WBA6_9ACTN|nr:hypothetical protein Are01nite_15570 [Actinoplanes regularis]GLW27265.1 hypothetical protein Areg01_02060 [Actinoplanes regularis]SNR43697.1 hypothetical protein SAMN06264365_102352 [Actinoplanes regularis]